MTVKSEIPLTMARAAILKAAASQLGVPYSYGGGDITGPSLGIDQGATTVGYDCARFTRYSYYQGTMNAQFKPRKFLPYGSEQQSKVGLLVGSTYADIANANLGDLIFFNAFGHVGILNAFAVADQWGNFYPQIIHAPKTGETVKLELVYPNEPLLAVCQIRQYVPQVEQPTQPVAI